MFSVQVDAFPSSSKEVLQKYGSAKTWLAVGDQISSFLASVLILVPVIVLHFVNDSTRRLLVIVVFTLVFSGLLVLATGARRSEVFAATSAFVAVQVVYIGSALSPQPSG